jgi:flagellar motor switch protein FliM
MGLTCKSGARGILAFDGPALALALDGVLGGDGSAIPSLGVLSPPQTALGARIADAVARAVADRINARFGTSLAPNVDERPSQASFLITHISIGHEASKGTVVLGLPRALASSEPAIASTFRAKDPAVAGVLADVDIELVIELGRVTVSLERLLSLKKGETILSDVNVATPVVVRADSNALFDGHPTNIAGRFAVCIERKIG